MGDMFCSDPFCPVYCFLKWEPLKYTSSRCLTDALWLFWFLCCLCFSQTYLRTLVWEVVQDKLVMLVSMVIILCLLFYVRAKSYILIGHFKTFIRSNIYGRLPWLQWPLLQLVMITSKPTSNYQGKGRKNSSRLKHERCFSSKWCHCPVH